MSVVTGGEVSVVRIFAVATSRRLIEVSFFNVSLAVCASSSNRNKCGVLPNERHTGELSGFTPNLVSPVLLVMYCCASFNHLWQNS